MIESKIYNEDYKDLLEKVDSKSVDLILTDPPYIISKKTGFKKVVNGVKRFAVDMDFGEWDKSYIDMNMLLKSFYDKLKNHGTAIVFYDIWKITLLKDAFENAGFKQLRIIIWEKTNPVPLNSKSNYLTNAREIAILGVKNGNSTFNSKYDKGVYKIASNDEIYNYPIEHGKYRFHPTQKPLKLFEELILKHSNENDVVLDTFLGSGTTALASLNTNRNFIGSEISYEYYMKSIGRIENVKKTKCKTHKKRTIFRISEA